MAYVAVAKALYDYDAQDPHDEISFKEDQLLYIIEKGDDEWWKAKVQDADHSDDSPIGLIPCTYVEEIPAVNHTRALYAYQSTSPEELSMDEDDVLHVYATEDEWILVALDGAPGKLGFVPTNYCEPLNHAAAVGVADSAQAAADVEAQRAAEKEDDRKRKLAEQQAELRAKDKVETWAISEVDGKKKRKGTLGVGNGAIFFASDSDKSPVKQYPITELSHVDQPSAKLLVLTVDSASAPLQFNTGGTKISKAIVAKLEFSKQAAGEVFHHESQVADGADEDDDEEEEDDLPVVQSVVVPPAPKTVRWADPAPESPVSPVHHGAPTPPSALSPAAVGGGESCVVLYDFTAGGDDELTVNEGEQLSIVEKENDEWWLVRNAHGQEGVVPAQYVEVTEDSAPANGAANTAAARALKEEESRNAAAASAAAAAAALREEESRKAEQRAAIERAAHEREAQEAADRELAEQIEAEERSKREKNARRLEEEERLQHEAEVAKRREAARRQEPPKVSQRPSAQDVASAARSLPSTKGRSAPAPAENHRPKPNPARTRTWSDRTGQFKVEAEFLGMSGNKLRLHKTNGVIIEVPLDKMSNEDAQMVRRYVARKERQRTSTVDDDNVPLGKTQARRQSENIQRTASPKQAADRPRRPAFDWFTFFLDAGCDMDDSTRYAAAFERDRIDESILTDLEASTMRSLGLREGDVIRVKKAINAKYGKRSPEQEAQIKSDEDYARQLQDHEDGGSKGPAPAAPPALFTSSDGKLANHRRGRPERRNTVTDTVDSSGLAAASEQLSKVSLEPTRKASIVPPVTVSPPPEPVVKTPAAPTNEPLINTGFDDDAWTIKPAAKPSTPVSAPPTAITPQHTQANGTDALLAQINSLRPASTGAPAPAVPQRSATSPVPAAAAAAPAPSSYGLGAANTTTPMSQLQQQPQLQVAPAAPAAPPQPDPNAPRGPLAPVPANQGLLQPLQSTMTGVFVPTRNAGGFQAPQATGFQAPQATGFQGGGMMAQPTGYMQSPVSPFGQQAQQPMQPAYTGFGGFQQPQQQSTFNTIASLPPPQMPQMTGAPASGDKFAPSNIFSAMKRTDFAKPEEQQPQSANKYDALRPLTTGYNGGPQTLYAQQTGMPAMQMQATGMPGMMPQMMGYNQMGYMQQPQNPYGYRG